MYKRQTVTSSDDTKTAYYSIKWVRNKLQRQIYLREGDLYTSPVGSAGNDGKIMGLDESEYYDYRMNGASEWIHVNGVSEITGLSEGQYQIKYGESPEYKANDDYNTLRLTIGKVSESMNILNNTDYNISVSYTHLTYPNPHP